MSAARSVILLEPLDDDRRRGGRLVEAALVRGSDELPRRQPGLLLDKAIGPARLSDFFSEAKEVPAVTT